MATKSKNKLVIKMDNYSITIITRYFGDGLDVAATELLLHIAKNGSLDAKVNVGTNSYRVGRGDNKELDIIQLVAGWLSRGEVKNLDDAVPKLRDWGTWYPIYHLWPAIKEHAKKLKDRLKNQADGNVEGEQQTDEPAD